MEKESGVNSCQAEKTIVFRCMAVEVTNCKFYKEFSLSNETECRYYSHSNGFSLCTCVDAQNELLKAKKIENKLYLFEV